MKSSAPEKFRITPDLTRRLGLPERMGTTPEAGRNGLFYVPCCREILRCVVSDGEGWEHVSVSLARRCPTWTEMCFIKEVFWDGEEVVVQYHPRESEYVNNHPFCLHLWKPSGITLPTPAPIMVGIKSAGTLRR